MESAGKDRGMTLDISDDLDEENYVLMIIMY
jgi:hypothetical protein